MNKSNWGYANLSRNAKNAGGPDQYLRSVFDLGREVGHRNVVAKTAAGVFFGMLFGICLEKAIQYFRE